MIHSVFLENFKGTTAEIDLKQLNIFRGTSGSGKSTWLEAVRVAILGHDPGYGKLLAETMAFASEPRMSVQVYQEGTLVKRIFENKEGKLSQTILINGTKMTQVLAEQEIAKSFGQFPMMLNPDEFFEMSDDKKITFLFGLSNTETDSIKLRRKCVIGIIGRYTDTFEFILGDRDSNAIDNETFDLIARQTVGVIAKKNVEAGRALTKIFSEFLSGTFGYGQETLSTYVNVLKEEINATRRAKGDAEAANRKLMEEKTDKLKLINYNDADNQEEIEKLRGEISEIEKELHVNDKLRDAKERLLSGLEIHGAAVVDASLKVKELEDALPSEKEKKEASTLWYACEHERYRLSEQIFKAETKRLKLEKEYVKVISKHEAVTSKVICKICGEELGCIKCVTTNVDKLEAEEAMRKTSEKVQEVYDYVEKVLATSDSNDEDQVKLGSVMAAHDHSQEVYEITVERHIQLARLVSEEKENLDKIEEPGAGDDTLKAQLSGLKVTLGERLVAAKNHDWLRTLSATIARANETISNSTALLSALSVSISEVKVVRDELTASATSAIEEVCNGLLQEVHPSFKLEYDIEDGKFDVQCVNVSGVKVPFKTLSGGEKVLYLSAQLLALMTIVDPKLKILEVEMGELSGNLVPPFMDALEAMTKDRDIQVVLSSCHGDFEVNSSAWAVHEMGGE